MARATEVKGETYILIATVIASSMSFITTTATGVLLPAIQRDLGLSGTQLLWAVNAYALFLSSLMLVGGALGDRFGRKRLLLIGVGWFAAASLLVALAPTGAMLISARGLQGIGGAIMVPSSLAVLSAGYPAERRGRAIGYWSTFTSLGVAVGPVIGGWLAGEGLWRVVFYLNIALAAVVFLLARFIPESVSERYDADLAHVDWPGALLVTLGLAALTYGFTEVPERGWGSPVVLAMLGGGVLALAGFVWVELHSKRPLVPLELFRSPVFSGGNLLTFFVYAALGTFFFFLPLNLIQAQGYPDALAGLASLPFIILLTVLSPWAGRLVDRIGPRLPLIVGPLITGGGFLWLSFAGVTGGPADYWLRFMPGIALIGIGMGLTVAPLTTAVMRAASDALAGAASGINNAVTSTAEVLAVAVLGALALLSFSQMLAVQTADLPLSVEARVALAAEADKLGGAEVPPEVPPSLAEETEAALRQSFVDTVRIVMWVCAALAWLGALVALIWIR